MIKIRDRMTKNLVEVSFDSSCLEASITMTEKNVGCLLIQKENKIVGIVSEQDFIRKILSREKNPKTTKINEIMASPVITVPSGKSIIKAAEIMNKNNTRHLGVEEDGKIVGIITARDLQQPIFLDGEGW